MTIISSVSGSKIDSTRAIARFGGKFDKKFLTALWLLFIGKTIAVEVRMLMHGRKVGVVLSFAPSRFPLFQQEIPAGGTEDAIHAEVVVSLHLPQTRLHLGAKELVTAPNFIRVIALVLHE